MTQPYVIRRFLVLALLGGLVGSILTNGLGVLMGARNSSGSYSLPAGNPVVTHTTIAASTFNSTMTDVAAELTNSLDRQGRGSMNAPLPLASGSAAAPSLTFSSGTNDGWYRIGTHDLGMTLNGSKVVEYTSAGIALATANPASTTAETNILTPKNVAKAWGLITLNGSGGCTVADGFNLTSCAVAAGGDITVTFASNFLSSPNYAIFGTISSSGPKAFYVLSASAGSCVVRGYNSDLTTERDCSANACTLSFMAIGAQ